MTWVLLLRHQCPCIVIIILWSLLLVILPLRNGYKNIEINCHYVCDMVFQCVISMQHVALSSQSEDILPKASKTLSYDTLCAMLGIFDLYTFS